MARSDSIGTWSKCRVTLPLRRETGEPYGSHIIAVFNKVFRHDVPAMGNCNWGMVEVLCWGHQVQEFKNALCDAGRSDFANFGVHVEKIERWPNLPIDATGDDGDHHGLQHMKSYPKLIADQRKELERITKQVDSMKNALKLMTGDESFD